MDKIKRKSVSTGYEDFKEIIDENVYYVDKSLLIEELLEAKNKATLITRPRRFGKTLNLSMIRRFFEDERTPDGEKIDNGYLFDGLAISRCGEDVLKHQQQYPFISISLKSAKQTKYELAYGQLKKQISQEFKRHKYVLQGDVLSEHEKKSYQSIMNVEDDDLLFADSLKFLSECLARYHQKKVIILIDEYDVPLENAYTMGFYDEMIGFIRSLFESALKTNDFLERGVITGCLRISRESIFTGLNNLAMHSVTSPYFSEQFGFTPEEVKACLNYYGLEEKYPEVKEWYDGYRFHKAEIYNPWSVLKYVEKAIVDLDALPEPYWANTSSNSIIRELVAEADNATRRDLEILMNGDFIEKPIHEDITYEDIHTSQDNLWNFLFFTGYLKAGEKRQVEGDIYLTMSIPNWEIKSIYRNSISEWFDKKAQMTDNNPLLHALEEGDCEAASSFLSQQLMGTISYFDYAENYYHGFLTGILAVREKYSVESNRESGTERPDLILKENRFMGRAMVIELKIAETFQQMEGKCEEALAQIEREQYAQPLADDGYRPVLKYAVCFYKKGCIVRKAE